MYREIEEEFIIIQDENRIDPMEVSDLLTTKKVTITNQKLPERTNETCGELYQRNGRAYFTRVYKVGLPLDDIIIYDGEEDPNGKSLDRLVAVVPLSKLEGWVMPVKVFRSRRRIEPRLIDLSGNQTDTLEWLRKNRKKIYELL